MNLTPPAFHLVREEGLPTVATNGATRLVCLDEGGVLKLRRGIRTAVQGPVAERLLPLLNQLAGDLVGNSAMGNEELCTRLHALQLLCKPVPAQHVEWAFCELDGVRVYTDGADVIVTRQDLQV